MILASPRITSEMSRGLIAGGEPKRQEKGEPPDVSPLPHPAGDGECCHHQATEDLNPTRGSDGVEEAAGLLEESALAPCPPPAPAATK
ncbi:unnamed protein product [Scytosiphon promiscuus]